MQISFNICRPILIYPFSLI